MATDRLENNGGINDFRLNHFSRLKGFGKELGQRLIGRDRATRQEGQLRLFEPSILELSDEVVDSIRATYAMEGKRRNAIDFDLAPEDLRYSRFLKFTRSAPTVPEWREIIRDLQVLHRISREMEVPNDPKVALQLGFLQDTLAAHILFYQEKLGIKLPWEDRVKITQGFTPQEIDETVIRAQLEAAKIHFPGNWNKASIEKFRSKTLSPADFTREITEHSQTLLVSLSRFLGRDFQPTYRVTQDSVDEYWINWTDGKRDDFRLRVNTHPRHAHKLTKAKAWAMSVHEVGGHVAQMYRWQRAIDEGKTIPALGITSLHIPEQVACEGIAQTLHHFVPELLQMLPEDALFELELEGVRQLAYNNLQIRANRAKSQGKRFDLRRAVHYVQEFFPAEPAEEVAKQLDERTKDGERNPYLLSYGMGFLLHRQIATQLRTEGKKKLLEVIFSQPTSPRQEFEIAQAIVSNPNYGYSPLKNPFVLEDTPLD